MAGRAGGGKPSVEAGQHKPRGGEKRGDGKHHTEDNDQGRRLKPPQRPRARPLKVGVVVALLVHAPSMAGRAGGASGWCDGATAAERASGRQVRSYKMLAPAGWVHYFGRNW